MAGKAKHKRYSVVPKEYESYPYNLNLDTWLNEAIAPPPPPPDARTTASHPSGLLVNPAALTNAHRGRDGPDPSPQWRRKLATPNDAKHAHPPRSR